MHDKDDQPEPAVSERGESPSPTGSADSPQSPDAAAFAVAERVVDLPQAERDDALTRLAPSPEVARRARELLGATERMDEFLEHSPIEAALQRPDGLPPGAAIGPWRVEALLGSGAMGDVYRATPAAGGDWAVAVKLMRPGVVPGDLRRRFEFEISTLATLHHPNIARHIESGVHQSEEGPRPYLAMELVQGRPITEHAREAGLDRRAVIGLFLRACAGVEHAHRSGVIHRDLKPSHLVVDAATGEPKVLDFGVARALDAAGTLSSMPGRHLVGTLPYMSPEQAAGDPSRPVDTRADVFAMGAVLYELFAGRPPHDPGEGSMADLLERVMHGVPPRLSTLVPDVARDLDRIVHAAIDPDPSRRYQSVAAMAEDLRRHLRGEPIAIEPPGLWSVLVASARRHRGRFVAAAAVTATIAGLVVFGAVQLVRAREAERKAEQALQEVAGSSLAMLMDANTTLYNTRQPLEAKRVVLEATRRHLEGTVERVGDDPIVVAALVKSYAELARITGASGDDSLSLRDEAAALIDRAETLGRRLIAIRDTPEHRMALSFALGVKAFIVALPERPAVFAQAADEAARAAALADPAERGRYERHDINLRSRSAATQGDRATMTTCVERLRAVSARNPDDPDVLDELGIMEWLLGGLLDDGGHPGAREAFDAAKRTLERSIQLGRDHYSNRRLIPVIRMRLLKWRLDSESPESLVRELGDALVGSRRAWEGSPAGNIARGAHLRSVLLGTRVGLILATHVSPRPDVARQVLVMLRDELARLEADPGRANPHAEEPELHGMLAPLITRLEAIAADRGVSPEAEPPVR
jgi:hypothetical protein